MKYKEKLLKNKSSKIAFISVMSALTALMSLLLVPMPKPLAEYDLSPILIYAFGVLTDPLVAGLIIGIGEGIGTTIKTINFGWPLVFVPGAVIVRGFEAVLISYISQKIKQDDKAISRGEIVALIIGVIWETVGFTIADVILFGPGMAMITLLTIVDAIFIPVAIPLIVYIRKTFNVYRFL
ncbi:MAG: hypothetical protein J7K23_08100 [Thermoproteales archaeon]|nr:hypothetical protein [Thermoproteales archaeon]